MTEPTEAMIEAGEFAWMNRKPSGPSSPLRDCYLAMKALDPDTHCASSDEVEAVARIIENHHCDSWTSGTACAEEVLTTLAAMSAQSDKGEG